MTSAEEKVYDRSVAQHALNAGAKFLTDAGVADAANMAEQIYWAVEQARVFDVEWSDAKFVWACRMRQGGVKVCFEMPNEQIKFHFNLSFGDFSKLRDELNKIDVAPRSKE